MKTTLLRAALFTPAEDGGWGLPLLLWGLPGVAKSAIVKQITMKYGLPVEVLSPASRGEGAFGVTPVPENGRMTYPRPDWTDRFAPPPAACGSPNDDVRRGVVFVDEINLAASHYAGALLGLLQERVIGSYRFGGGVRILAAANPVDIAAASGGWDLSAPAANRVGHLDWGCPSVKEWSDWILSDEPLEIGDSNAAIREEQRIMSAWPEAWGRARGIVTGFLSAHDILHRLPPIGSAELSRAWPSPRTWSYATRAIASSQVHALSNTEREDFISAFVGTGASNDLCNWLVEADLPNSAMLLDGKVKWKFKPSRLDIAMAVFSSATATAIATTEEDLRKRRAEAVWTLLAQAVDQAPDILVAPMKSLIQAKLHTGNVTVLVKSKMLEILAAVGTRTERIA